MSDTVCDTYHTFTSRNVSRERISRNKRKANQNNKKRTNTFSSDAIHSHVTLHYSEKFGEVKIQGNEIHSTNTLIAVEKRN